MRHFLFEDKEYRINPYFKRWRRNEQDSAVALAKLIRRLIPRSRRGSGGSKSFGGRKGVDARQNCMVKMQYSNSIKAHRIQLEKYLVREGTDIDGSGAKLYGTDLEEYKNNMVGRNFRIFLSPQSDKINLKDLAEKFIKNLEQQTGYTFYWQAANHYNTAHPHAHLLINGKDKNGREVDIPRDIVKTFMREYARDICTSQIGNRTTAEIAVEREKELEARRFTKLDKKIKELAGDSFKVYTNQIYSDRERVLARLENLRKLGMCTYDKGAYRLSPKWEENLKANARYNTFLAARSELKYADPSKLKVYTGEDGVVTGKVTKIYKLDEDASDNHAVVIESLDGKSAYFVPLFKAPLLYHGKGKANLRENEIVSIETYKSQKGRLTPLIFKNDVSQSYKEFVKNNYSGVKTGLR
jgi:hypothetical protein